MKTATRDAYYLLIDDETQGPFSRADLQNMLTKGSITPQTTATKEGDSDWVPLQELLRPKSAAKPPAPYGRIYPLMAVATIVFAFVWASKQGSSDMNIGVTALCALALGFAGSVIYFIPCFVAANLKHRNEVAIIVLNFFLGWTFVGWVIALIWAVKKD